MNDKLLNLKFLNVDTETSGFRRKDNAKTQKQFIMQISWCSYALQQTIEHLEAHTLAHKNRTVHPMAFKTHKIALSSCPETDCNDGPVMDRFIDAVAEADVLVFFNADFDFPFVCDKLIDLKMETRLIVFKNKLILDPMKALTDIIKLPPANRSHTYKYPKQREAYEYYYQKAMPYEHAAFGDVIALKEIVEGMYCNGHFPQSLLDKSSK